MNWISLILSVALLGLDGPVAPAITETQFASRLPVVPSKPSLRVLGEQTPPLISARSAAVYDPLTKRFLFEHNADRIVSIASITKLMTAMVVLQSGVDLNSVITVTRDDNDPEGAHLDIPEGATVSVRDLLNATLVASTNNTAEALARASGKSEPQIVSEMNELAKSLGMNSSKFTDVTGLGNSNVSTARDLMILAEHAFAIHEIREATSKPAVAVTDLRTGDVWRAKSTDQLLGTNLNVLAGKTGFTGAAGYCLLSQIRGIGEHDLYIVALGSSTPAGRFDDVRALADWAFAHHRWNK